MELTTPVPSTVSQRSRIDSVDLVRGLVMVIMALDHVRYPYFTNIPIWAESTQQTYLALFLTRWITHFCAPLFFLLAGTGAYLSTTRGKTIAELSRFLWTRGLWLVVLELTVIGFAWSFMPGWGFGGVIWSLGWSMVILALVVRLPLRWVALFGIGVMVLHHFAEGVSPDSFGSLGFVWRALYAGGGAGADWLPGGFFPFLFSIFPLAGVMAAGYALGAVLEQEAEKRRRRLFWIGFGMTVAFFALRLTNLYGHPIPLPGYGGPGLFGTQDSIDRTIISLLNVQKYPTSLQFLLMTIGPSLMLLSWFDRFTYATKLGGWWGKRIIVFGRVPMFYYILHLLFIHLLAIGIGWIAGQPVGWLWGKQLPFVREAPPEYGYGLPETYLITIFVVVVLYFPCRWFADLKKRRKDWWLSYL